jgi:hypothetical protein
MTTPVPNDTPQPVRGIPGLPPDWPEQATQRIVATVDTVRSKSSGPAIKISRGVVYGLVAALVAAIGLPLLIIGLVRGLILLLNDAWLAYLILSVLFIGAGLFVWRLRPKGAAVPRPPA